jgi:hypothetical protein
MKKLCILLSMCFIVCRCVAQQKPALQIQFDSLNNVSRQFFQTGKLDSLPSISQRMLTIAQKTGIDTLFIEAYNVSSLYFEGKNDYTHDLQFLYKAIDIAGKSDVSFLPLLYHNVGIAHAGLEDYPAALQAMLKGLQRLPPVTAATGKNARLLVYFHTTIGYLYYKLNRPDSALKYAGLADRENRFVKDNFVQSRIIFTFAGAYEETNRPELVNYYYKKAISYSDSVNNIRALGIVLNQYSQYLLKQKQYPDAKKYAIMGLGYNTKLGAKSKIVESANLLYTIYLATASADSAYSYLKIKDSYQDKLLAEQRANQLQSVIVNAQIKENDEATKAAEAVIERKHNLQYAAIAIGIITLVILFLLLSRSVLVSERLIEFFGVIGLLVVFEFINLVIHPYVAHLTNESPIWMLLILVAIAAVIVPLHHKLEHVITRRLVEKNKAIRLELAKKADENEEES